MHSHHTIMFLDLALSPRVGAKCECVSYSHFGSRSEVTHDHLPETPALFAQLILAPSRHVMHVRYPVDTSLRVIVL